MRADRRQLLSLAGGAGLALATGLPSLAQDLTQMTGGVMPISKAERLSRMAKAQDLMRAQGLSALVVEPGAALTYFTGVRWNRSERVTAAIIPVEGETLIVTPHFEEPSVRETLAVPGEVRVWQEDENPAAVAAAWLKERKLAAGRIGVEETVRFFVSDGLARLLPDATIVSGAPIVRGCRMIKSPAEIALMQMASDITIAAYRHTWPKIERGMTPGDIGGIMNRATAALGGRPEFALILLGEASAYPHGSDKPQMVRGGQVVLMDCGCTVEGYQSDISRTFVFGEPTRKQRLVWDQVHRGQQIAFETAQVGVAAGAVDDAVRAYYEPLGYGPRYRLPGLSHRTGHGIGLDGHEPVNFVHGEATRLAPGMCLSDEPGLYIPGEFGVRLEDCLHMTPGGPEWFSVPPPSLDKPFG
ncbi:Xaa-Pro peptidase family protein [Phenylobacterium sp. LH3H17]|uniref:M24 family metallopeptidase n=1 Tax=Phenylobacterium sp. LH3H17 TaxID=2903901 RepID=UPI0020C9F3C0|nr:Xaa-Pro peptidase family protein [Phenylobacterium sp. LH3H17]UTP40498.1 Xaa-Pro peptidase family protein [Phenylobacterium sp. LH3H17]